jgi:hypothetical protein
MEKIYLLGKAWLGSPICPKPLSNIFSPWTLELLNLHRSIVITKTGERFWAHEEVYFPAEIDLKSDDIFLFNKIQYRVLEIENWTEYGYNKYTVLQDYTILYEVKPVVIND